MLVIQTGKPRLQTCADQSVGIENPHLLTLVVFCFPAKATGLLTNARDPDRETATANRKPQTFTGLPLFFPSPQKLK
jgi:hypothetical protein